MNSTTSLIIQRTSIATAVDDALQELEAAGVHLPQLSEVRDYLTRHPDLIDITLRVVRAARDEIGGQTQLSLEIYHSSQVNDLYPTLNVRRNEYVEDIFDLVEVAPAAAACSTD